MPVTICSKAEASCCRWNSDSGFRVYLKAWICLYAWLSIANQSLMVGSRMTRTYVAAANWLSSRSKVRPSADLNSLVSIDLISSTYTLSEQVAPVAFPSYLGLRSMQACEDVGQGAEEKLAVIA